jgi:hypothetical protein
MAKLMSLVRAPAGIDAAEFAARWRDELLPDLLALPGIGARINRVIHHHVVPSDIRAEEGVATGTWAGIASYYLDGEDSADGLPNDPAWLDVFARHPALVAEAVHLPIEEVWLYNRDRSHLPLKMFAFFKRKPNWSRAEALVYYRTTHAEVGESINHNRTVRYIQNHIRPGFHAANPRYDFDAGPEIWFKSMEIALDLFNDREGMAILAADEEKFVQRDALLNFLTDEQEVFAREAVSA